MIPDPNNAFFVRANGDSMTGAGIFDQDLLIVYRSKKKPNGKVVIASLNKEFTLKRPYKPNEGTSLWFSYICLKNCPVQKVSCCNF